MSFLKGFFIALLIMVVIAAGVLWVFRYDIFQYSAEGAIKRMLPEYVHVDAIVFDLGKGTMTVEGFSVKNPEGYHNRYLATIDRIQCRYRMRGENILDGIEVTSIEAVTPHINIDRSSNGKININDMGKVMGRGGRKGTRVEAEPAESGGVPGEVKRLLDPGRITGKKLSDVIELTDTVKVRNGKVTFLDKMVSSRGYILTFEDFNGDIIMDIKPDFSGVTEMSTEGYGHVNGEADQRLRWRVTWWTSEEPLHLSSRFELSTVDVTPFKPYYDKYSPVDIVAGRASGTLVFNFDNGQIGSKNQIRLAGMRYREKDRGGAGRFWTVATTDIIKYLESSPGEITFDFSIKGDVDSPKIAPGPYVKQAMQMMAIDTISSLVYGPGEAQAPSSGETGADPVQSAPKSDAEKVVDIIRQLMREQQR